MTRTRDAERLTLPAAVEWKAAAGAGLDDEGTVEGWAAVYGVVGEDGDVVSPGAFAKTASDWSRASQPLPLIADHQLSSAGVVGSIVGLRDDRVGLWFKAKFGRTQKAQDLRANIIDGHIRGVSWTAAVLKSRPGNGAVMAGRQVARYLDELRLFEVTLSPFPIYPEAGVTVAAAAPPEPAAPATLAEIDQLQRDLEAWAITAAMPPALATRERITLGALPTVAAAAAPTPPAPPAPTFGGSPVATNLDDLDTLDRFSADLDAEAARSAPVVSKAQQVDAFLTWVRTGNRQVAQAAALVENTTGEILVPPSLALDILNEARAGVFRSLITPRPTDRNKHSAGLLGAAAVGWGKLETGGALTDANVLPENPAQVVEIFDLTALAQVGVDELDDSPVALQAAIVDAIGSAMADAEDVAYAAGSGVNQPSGLGLAANVTRIAAGQKTTAAGSGVPTIADLRALPWKLPARYRRRGVWLFSDDAAAAIAALVDTGGGPIWPNPGNPDPTTGGGFLGWPAYVVPLPAMTGTNAASVMFADLPAAYRIAERTQALTVQRLDERYAELGLRGFLCRLRAGGSLIRPSAATAYLL